MKFLFWIVIALIAVVLALFAASNRTAIALGLWPFPFAVDLPLYLAVLAALLIGFIAGAVVVWLASGRRRREARHRGRRIAVLEHELAAAQARLPDVADNPPPRLPARRFAG